jgi:hypothetical protein
MKIGKKHLFGILIFIISYIIYIITSAPGLMFTDSGELAGAAVTLGIAHPTGYPLFIILAHLWSLIPLPITKILMLNYFAGFLVALSASIFYYSTFIIFALLEKSDILENLKFQSVKTNKHKKSKDKTVVNSEFISKNNYKELLACISALLFAFALTIWDLATMIEVYPLQVLMFNLIIYYFLKSINSTDRSKRYLIITSLIIGLAFSNHLTTLLILPAVLGVYLLTKNWEMAKFGDRFKYLLILLIPLLIGVSPYLFLIIRSASEPIFDWGGVSRSIDKFIYHVSGKQFQIWMFTGEGIGKNVKRFFELIPFQLGFIGILPLIMGFIYLVKKSRLLLSFFLLMVLGCFIYAINYSIHDIDSYFSLAFIGILMISAVGIYYFSNKLGKYSFALILFPIISFAINYTSVNKSNNDLVNTYTELVCKGIKPNAIVISSQWDYFVSAFWYKQAVEGYRKDIDLVEKELSRRTWYPLQLSRLSPEVCKPAQKEINEYLKYLERFESGEKFSDLDNINIQNLYIKMLRTIIDSAIDKRPVYVSPEIYLSSDGIGPDFEIIRGYNLLPEGLAYRLVRDTNYVSQINTNNFKLDKLVKIFDDLRFTEKNDHLIEGLKNYLIMNIINGAAQYCNKTNQFETGKYIIEQALRLEPDNVNLVNIKNFFNNKIVH